MGWKRFSLFAGHFDSPCRAGFLRNTYVSVLVEHPNDAVGQIEDVSPVEVGHVRLPLLRRAAVQEVEDVPGGERRVRQSPVDEIHHGRVADGVLKSIGRKLFISSRARLKREVARNR